MPLDPTYEEIRKYRVATGFTPLYTMSVEDARVADAETEAANWDWHEHPDEVFDREFEGPAGTQQLRVYRPRNDDGGPLPVLVYFMGGGWVVGSLDTSDSIARALSTMVPCIVVSVSYRLAPEHPFPAAVDDCYAGVEWVARHTAELGGDPERIAVGGDSSGGTLAAAMSLMSRDHDGPALGAQVLTYPALVVGADTTSMRENNDTMFFNATSSGWFWKHYLADPADRESPYAAPLNASDHGGLPPTMIVAAEYCPLHDEAEQYATALQRAGVPVEYLDHEGLPHGFLAMSAVLERARATLGLIADFLAKQLRAR